MRRLSKLFFSTVCFSILILGPAAFADEAALKITLSSALLLAETRNPALKVGQKQVEEARFSYQSARAIPSLSATGNYTTGNNTIVSNNGQTRDVNVVLSQSFGPLGSVGLSGKSAEKAYRIAKANYGEIRISVLQSVKDGFYGLLASREQLRIAEENLELADELYDLVLKRFNAGAAPRTDLVNAEIQKAALEQGLISARASKKQASAVLANLLGLVPNQSIEVSGNLDFPFLSFTLDSLLNTAGKERPLVAASNLAVEQAKTQIALASSQRNPAPSLLYSYDLTTTPLWLFGASFQFPIFDYGQIRNQVKLQESTLHEKEHAREGIWLSIVSSVRLAYANYTAAVLNAATYKEKVVNPSEELLKMTRFGYVQGALPYFQVVAAEQGLKNAQTQYVSILLAGHLALDALEAAAGETLEGDLR